MVYYRLIYNILIVFLIILLSPFLSLYICITGKYKQGIWQRLGFYPVLKQVPGKHKIWIHAVSVGEVNAAIPVIKAICDTIPCVIVLSTSTSYGYETAIKNIGSKAVCVYAPFDFIFSVRKALYSIKPDLLVFFETEIWPNWFYEAKKMGIKTTIINGRLSVRSIKKYMKIRAFISQVLKNIDLFSMIHKDDAKRIIRLGADKTKVYIKGNSKLDVDVSYELDMSAHLENIFELGNRPVLIAGSIRKGEDKIILEVYQKILEQIPDTVLIIAPRHINRVKDIQKLAQQYCLSYQLRSELDHNKRRASVIIIDTIGELKSIYKLGTVIFCGGSLVPVGGHNILEPAIMGKPVLYGPSMEDFYDAKLLLEQAGAGIEVKDKKELIKKIIFYFKNPDQAYLTGLAAKNAIMENQGAARRHADLICKLIRA